MAEYMLTTVDNPYDPFTEYDEWFNFDVSHGYNSTALLARVVVNSDDIADGDQLVAIQEAIDEIVKYNVSGMHRKAQPSDYA